MDLAPLVTAIQIALMDNLFSSKLPIHSYIWSYIGSAVVFIDLLQFLCLNQKGTAGSSCSPSLALCSFDDSHSYIHPFIKKKIYHHWDMTFNQNKEAPNHHGMFLLVSLS